MISRDLQKDLNIEKARTLVEEGIRTFKNLDAEIKKVENDDAKQRKIVGDLTPPTI
jgi:hypothetical protein